MAASDVEIPTQYSAAVYDAPGSISTKVEKLDTPEPGPGEVLIRLYFLPLTLSTKLQRLFLTYS